jgi:hypothetical protein
LKTIRTYWDTALVESLLTTHYSAVELSRLLEAANRVCDRKGKQPELVILRRLNVS